MLLLFRICFHTENQVVSRGYKKQEPQALNHNPDKVFYLKFFLLITNVNTQLSLQI